MKKFRNVFVSLVIITVLSLGLVSISLAVCFVEDVACLLTGFCFMIV